MGGCAEVVTFFENSVGFCNVLWLLRSTLVGNRVFRRGINTEVKKSFRSKL